jgi:hypothetical protein
MAGSDFVVNRIYATDDYVGMGGFAPSVITAWVRVSLDAWTALSKWIDYTLLDQGHLGNFLALIDFGLAEACGLATYVPDMDTTWAYKHALCMEKGYQLVGAVFVALLAPPLWMGIAAATLAYQLRPIIRSTGVILAQRFKDLTSKDQLQKPAVVEPSTDIPPAKLGEPRLMPLRAESMIDGSFSYTLKESPGGLLVIRTETAFVGMGFRIASDLIVTAKHVIDTLSNVPDVRYDDEGLPTIIIGHPTSQMTVEIPIDFSNYHFPSELDIVCLRVDPDYFSKIAVKQVDFKPTPADATGVACYYLDEGSGKLCQSFGNLKAAHHWAMVLHNCSTDVGSSGSFITHNKVAVAMHIGTSTVKGYNLAIRLDMLHILIKRIGNPESDSGRGKGKKFGAVDVVEFNKKNDIYLDKLAMSSFSFPKEKPYKRLKAKTTEEKPSKAKDLVIPVVEYNESDFDNLVVKMGLNPTTGTIEYTLVMPDKDVVPSHLYKATYEDIREEVDLMMLPTTSNIKKHLQDIEIPAKTLQFNPFDGVGKVTVSNVAAVNAMFVKDAAIVKRAFGTDLGTLMIGTLEKDLEGEVKKLMNHQKVLDMLNTERQVDQALSAEKTESNRDFQKTEGKLVKPLVVLTSKRQPIPPQSKRNGISRKKWKEMQNAHPASTATSIQESLPNTRLGKSKRTVEQRSKLLQDSRKTSLVQTLTNSKSTLQEKQLLSKSTSTDGPNEEEKQSE